MENLVSIVLPTYNGEKYLSESIESVINQTYKNWELIIVNDCSTDGTLEIIKKYTEKDERIKFITNEINSKLPQSLNNGFKLAKGNFYTWTSDDNYYDPKAIEQMVNYLILNPDKAMVYADFYNLDEISNKKEKAVLLPVTPQNMLDSNCIGACFMYRKSIAEKVGEYDTSKFLVEDYDYWLRIMLAGKIGHIPQILYTYRIHNSSLTGKRHREVSKKAELLRSSYYSKYKEKFGDEISDVNKHKISFLNKIFSIRKDTNRLIIMVLGLKISLKNK